MVITANDPYRFPVLLGEQDRYLFNAGRNYRLYEHLGAHLTISHGIAGTVFRTWAPNARAVSVIGNFNGDAVAYNEGAAYVLLDDGGNATVTDADSANFSGGI